MRDGQRLHREGGVVGREDGPEDRAHPGARPAAAGSAALPGRCGGRSHLGADQDLPRPLPRRPHLLQRGAALRGGAAGVRTVRAFSGGLGLSPGPHRLRDHGRRQGESLRGIAPHGRDGDRGEDHPRGAGRGPDALYGLGLRRHARRFGRGGHRALPTLSELHARLLPGAARGGGRGTGQAGALDRGHRPLRPAQVVRHVRGHRSDRGRAARSSRSSASSPPRSSWASRASAAGRWAWWPTSPR